MGNQICCKRNHTLKKVDFKEAGPDWYCDLCRKSIRGQDNRFRCIAGCDFDVCRSCMQPHLTDGHVRPAFGPETTLLVTPRGRQPEPPPKPQSRLPHPHFVAYVVFRCDECRQSQVGDRLHCPADNYDLCHSCVLKKALQSEDGDTESNDEIARMSIEPQPFAEGASREAFKATAKMKSGKSVPYVVKGWKAQYLNQGCDMEECLKIHIKAHELSREFNKEIRTNHPIVFRKPAMHVMSDTYTRNGRKVFVKGEKVMLEPFIYGEYEKFTSNNGWSCGNYSIPEAFTHFTWHKTKELIVCDLQGNRQVDGGSNDGYYMTDPAICSLKPGKWGITDVGPNGIIQFFEQHKCNVLCQGWDKPTNLRRTGQLQIARATSYVGGRGASSSSTSDSDDVNNLLAALLLAALLLAAMMRQ